MSRMRWDGMDVGDSDSDLQLDSGLELAVFGFRFCDEERLVPSVDLSARVKWVVSEATFCEAEYSDPAWPD